MRIILILSLLAFLGFIFKGKFNNSEAPKSTENSSTKQSWEPEVVAEGLRVPWEIAFLPASPAGGPNGDMLVTERPGTLRKIGKDGTIITIEGVAHTSEGGLLGLALHPDFSDKGWLYLYLTARQGGKLQNRVERYRLDGNALFDRTVILEGIPGSANHDGGRIAFGPDKYLYITTGDAENQNLAQDKNSLAGKILRLGENGEIPADNPFENPVYSYGHRNPQGLAWDSEDRLWATEHGPSGSQTGNDEVNLIEKGKNYGWPLIRGAQTRQGMESPVIESGKSETWAPAGAAIWENKLFFTGLRGESLYVGEISGNRLQNLRALFSGQFGRLRAVTAGPDNKLYISTSNTDGRGTPQENDDRLLRIDPDLLP